MSKLIPAALAFVKEHWHIGISGTSDTTGLLGINPNTLKTRLSRHQAMVLRDPEGSLRDSLTFTGYHLVYNLIADRLLRYGFSVDSMGEDSDDPNKQGWRAHTYAQWAHDEILSGQRLDAVLRCMKHADGTQQVQPYEDDKDVLSFTGDAALIIPVGTMIVRLSTSLFARFGGEAFHDAVKSA